MIASQRCSIIVLSPPLRLLLLVSVLAVVLLCPLQTMLALNVVHEVAPTQQHPRFSTDQTTDAAVAFGDSTRAPGTPVPTSHIYYHTLCHYLHPILAIVLALPLLMMRLPARSTLSLPQSILIPSPPPPRAAVS